MRSIISAAAVLTLAACDSGGVIDQTVRAGARESAVQACAAWIPQSNIAVATGLSAERLCGCAADRVLEGTSSLSELRPDSAAARAAITQCIAENRKQPAARELGAPNKAEQ